MRSRTLFFSAGISLASALPVRADDGAAASSSLVAAQDPNDDAPLAGPKVPDVSTAPGAAMQFGPTAGPLARARDGRANLRVYGLILREMDLTGDQRRLTREVFAEYGAQARAYRDGHAPETRRLQDAVQRSGIRGEAAADGPASMPMETLDDDARQAGEAALARLREIQAARPPQEPYLQRLWSLLTLEQQAEFERRLDEHWARARQRRTARSDDARGANVDDATDDAGMTMAPPMDSGAETDADPDPVALDIDSLTLGERRRLEWMREEQRRLEALARRAASPPPPSIDSIEFEEEDDANPDPPPDGTPSRAGDDR